MVPEPLAWAANRRLVPAPRVWPAFSVHRYVTAAAVLLLVCVNWPPMVLNWPEKLTPVVLWITTVTDRAVSAAVLSTRSASSLNHGVFPLTRAVGVTTPPPPVGLTVRAIDVV